MDQAALKRKLASLRAEHKSLDTDIDKLILQPLHDQLAVQRMKKRKLQIKDEIIRIECQILPDIIA